MARKSMQVHGHRVDLVDVKAALKHFKRRQADVAEALGVHQTAVSRYLTGKDPASRAFQRHVEGLLTPSQADKLAQRAAQRRAQGAQGSTQPAAPPPPVSGAPHAAPTPAPAEEPEEAPIDAPSPARKSKAPNGFPAEDALKLANLARTAQADGHVSYGFGFRKLERWGMAYMTLSQEGFAHGPALIGSYDLAVRGKTEPGSEDRIFAEESFYTIFGLDAKQPWADHIPNRTPLQHPAYDLALPFVRASRPVWFYGAAGTGKTFAANAIADALGRGSITVQGSEDMTKDDFVGGLGAQDGNTVPNYGPLPLAMRNGWLLIVEEASVIPAGILMVLQQVLEGKPLTLTGMGEVEVIHGAPGFGVAVCDNTVGLGEGVEFVGTRAMNEAFRDRFFFVEYGHMADDLTLTILASALGGFAKEQGWA